MTNPQQHPNGPTDRQLKYLRGLADATGGSFAWPQTSKEASEEIDRLQKSKRTGRADRSRETRELRRDMASGRGDAARVRDAELGGYGSTAHWADDSDEDRDDPEARR
jgi:hypothetical protein